MDHGSGGGRPVSDTCLCGLGFHAWAPFKTKILSEISYQHFGYLRLGSPGSLGKSPGLPEGDCAHEGLIRPLTATYKAHKGLLRRPRAL